MRSGKAVKWYYCYEAQDNGKVLLLAPFDLVGWAQCILSSACSNVCQTQRAHAARNQRCLGAAQDNLADDVSRARRVKVCSMACVRDYRA
jgi:hypothetical protein